MWRTFIYKFDMYRIKDNIIHPVLSWHGWYLCWYVAKTLQLQFTLFCRETYFIAFTHFLCGKKLSPKCCLCRKKTKYDVWPPAVLFSCFHICCKATLTSLTVWPKCCLSSCGSCASYISFNAIKLTNGVCVRETLQLIGEPSKKEINSDPNARAIWCEKIPKLKLLIAKYQLKVTTNWQVISFVKILILAQCTFVLRWDKIKSQDVRRSDQKW